MKAYAKRCKAKFKKIASLNALPANEGNKVKHTMANSWQKRGVNLGWAYDAKQARR